MTSLLVEQCGPACSVQDMGRNGCRRIGLPRSGALDVLALTAANAIVGNPADSAAIESLLAGLTLRICGGPVRIAFAGADFPLSVDGTALARQRSLLVEPGQTLSIGSARRGVCGIVAVEGGLHVPSVLGSRSLHARSRVGGMHGRTLRPGDLIAVASASTDRPELELPEPLATATEPIRVVLGPQTDRFGAEQIRLFCETEWVVAGASDRMAYRLGSDARILPRHDDFSISEAMFEGAVQITAGGQPIVMLADHQTIGGYPKIAGVIAPDIRHVANRRPGEGIRFSVVSLEQARAAYLAWVAGTDSLPSRLRVAGTLHDRLTAHIADVRDAAVDAADPASWWAP